MKKYFVTLNIFRGFFALMVAFLHMSAWYSSKILNNNFVLNSYIFVDFFFVLSGFVITANYFNKNTFLISDFIKKRLLRVYPLHFLTLLIFLFLELGKNFSSSSLVNNSTDYNNTYNFFGNLFLINSIYFPKLNDLEFLTWNFPSWSISAEVFSYIFFSLILKVCLRYNKSSFYIISFIISITSFLILYSINLDFNYFYTYDFGFLRCLAGFFSGVFAYYVHKNHLLNWKIIKNHTFINFLELTFFIILFFLLYNLKYIVLNYGFIYFIFFPLFILIFSLENGFLSNFFNSFQLLHRIGNISYSIYMIHVIINLLFNVLFIRILHIPAFYYFILIPINIFVIIFVSNITYKNIELKFYKKQ